jgi:siroheme synthase
VTPETPCAIVSKATSREEKFYLTTVQELPLAPRLLAPTLLVVGAVARLARAAPLVDDLASYPSSEVVRTEAAWLRTSYDQNRIQERSS